ncbi:MAG TPA: c-type cytochrome [Povalibacter sp.]|nr:c-type cytochrome [Povalibacter sp.]
MSRFLPAILISMAAMHVAVASPARVDELVQTALQLDRHPANGARLFAKHCSTCHGQAATGDAARMIPALAGQRRAYLVKQLADFTEQERESKEMHTVVARAALREPQAWMDVAAWLNSLPAVANPQTGGGQDVELGEAIFQEQCASCHDDDARGDDDGFVPSLRGQHYSYLSRQMRALASSQRHNVEPDLVRFLDSFDADEISAVADYLSRMRKPAVRDRARLDSDGTVGD